MSAPNCGERLTGHGSEWQDAKLSPEDARTATNWVEQKIDKRSMLTNKDRVQDVRDVMWQLEKDGEIVVHRIRMNRSTSRPSTVGTSASPRPSSGITSPADNAAIFPAIPRRSFG